MSYKILHNQSLLDIAMQEHGDAIVAVQLALLNEREIDTTPIAGTLVNTLSLESPVSQYFKTRNQVLATLNIEYQYLFENGLFENGLFE